MGLLFMVDYPRTNPAALMKPEKRRSNFIVDKLPNITQKATPSAPG
jgi:hypothetical protein